jgi:hypothetical protein
VGIIVASALLLVGAFMMFMSWRIIQEKMVMTKNVNGQSPSNIKITTRRDVSLVKGLAIFVVAVIILTSTIAIGAVVIAPFLNQMSSDTDTDTTDSIVTDDTVTNSANAGTTIAMKDSDFEPKEIQVPLNDNIVWVNYEDDPPHTATSIRIR